MTRATGEDIREGAKRIFYQDQDKTSRNSEDPNTYTASVPGKGGTCSCKANFVPTIPAETAKRLSAQSHPSQVIDTLRRRDAGHRSSLVCLDSATTSPPTS